MKLPFLAGRAAYRHRPMWLWPTAPPAINPQWLEPTIEPKLKPAAARRPAPEPPSPKRPRNPYPKVHARRATGTTNRTTTAKGTTTMSASTPVQAAVEAASAIGTFQTDSVVELEAFLRAQSEVLNAFGQAYRLLAQRMTSEMPLAAPVGDATADLGTGFLALESLAQGMPAMLRAAHAEQWSALENPLPNQQMWDTTNNQ